MLQLFPVPIFVGRFGAAEPTHPIAAFPPYEGNHLAIGQEPQRRFVGMARHIEMRDKVVFHTIAAGDKLELPIGGPGFDLARLRSLLCRRACSFLSVIGDAKSRAVMPGYPP